MTPSHAGARPEADLSGRQRHSGGPHGTRRRLLAMACFVAAAACIAAAVAFAATGFAGPAPVALAAAGMCIAGGVALLHPPAPPPPRA